MNRYDENKRIHEARLIWAEQQHAKAAEIESERRRRVRRNTAIFMAFMFAAIILAPYIKMILVALFVGILVKIFSRKSSKNAATPPPPAPGTATMLDNQANITPPPPAIEGIIDAEIVD